MAKQTLTELRERNRRLSDFKRVSGYVVWPREFPRTTSMKVKRLQRAMELAGMERATAVQGL